MVQLPTSTTALRVCVFVYRFTGKERDIESGLDYFGARYFGSTMGRFMSPDPSGLYFADPANPQSLNLYSYAQNNPLTNVDPTGLDCVHINNDTGAYEGFESGDCNNSTEALANTGHYIDGTVNQISFNGQNQVTGYDASTSSGMFDTPGASNSGPAAFNLNPYTNTFTNPGQSITVTANQSQGPNTIGSVLTTPIHGPIQPPNPNITHYVSAYHPPAAPKVTGDPACYGAPDSVSAIHSIQQGNAQGQSQGSTDGSFGASIWQSTTQGNRPFGNAGANAGFNAGFMGLDYAVSVANCLQGH